MIGTDDEILVFPQGMPLFPVHPGATILRELKTRGLSTHRAALKMRVAPNRLGQIIAGKRAVTADTALRLAGLFGASAQFWMNLQTQFDLAITTRDHGATIAAEVEAA